MVESLSLLLLGPGACAGAGCREKGKTQDEGILAVCLCCCEVRCGGMVDSLLSVVVKSISSSRTHAGGAVLWLWF